MHWNIYTRLNCGWHVFACLFLCLFCCLSPFVDTDVWLMMEYEQITRYTKKKKKNQTLSFSKFLSCQHHNIVFCILIILLFLFCFFFFSFNFFFQDHLTQPPSKCIVIRQWQCQWPKISKSISDYTKLGNFLRVIDG